MGNLLSADGYEGYLSNQLTGPKWKVGLYAEPEVADDPDGASIANMYGGGGHHRAAGSMCDRLPFM